MPTGYTAAIADDITFDEFVMGCAARGMGALVMRNEPASALIPERFEPSDYHTKKIAEANATLGRLAGMTADEAEQAELAADIAMAGDGPPEPAGKVSVLPLAAAGAADVIDTCRHPGLEPGRDPAATRIDAAARAACSGRLRAAVHR
jgi:hypothetical protein